jgi:Peptidase M50B-like
MVSSRRALFFAIAAAWLLEHVVPFGRLVLYPFTLLATWVHETGHGLAALATGGAFDRLQIFWDASGLALTRAADGWPVALTSIGGLLAPPIVGAALLALARGPRRARMALAVLALALCVSLLFWVRSPAGFVVVPLAAVLLGWAAWGWPDASRLFLAQFIAATLALDTLGRMVSYAFASSVVVDGKEGASDVAHIAQAIGGPAFLWGIVVVVLAIAFLAAGAFVAWRPAPQRKRA